MTKQGKALVNFRRRQKIKLIEYKGGKCEECGFKEPIPPCYDFHHIKPEEKSFSIGENLGKNILVLKKEADKCSLLCKNCHAKIHYREYEKDIEEYKLISRAVNYKPTKNEIIDSLKNSVTFIDVARKYSISDSGLRNWCKFFNIDHKKFLSLNLTKVQIENQKRKFNPKKKELISVLQTHKTMISVGKYYNVSDNAIRKRCKILDIDYKKILGSNTDF